jgi:hypothetical protein
MRESIILSATIKHTHIYTYIFICIYAVSYIVVSEIKRLVVCIREVYSNIGVYNRRKKKPKSDDRDRMSCICAIYFF